MTIDQKRIEKIERNMKFVQDIQHEIVQWKIVAGNKQSIIRETVMVVVESFEKVLEKHVE